MKTLQAIVLGSALALTDLPGPPMPTTRFRMTAAEHQKAADDYLTKAKGHRPRLTCTRSMAKMYGTQVKGPSNQKPNPWLINMVKHCKQIAAKTDALAAEEEKAAEVLPSRPRLQKKPHKSRVSRSQHRTEASETLDRHRTRMRLHGTTPGQAHPRKRRLCWPGTCRAIDRSYRFRREKTPPGSFVATLSLVGGPVSMALTEARPLLLVDNDDIFRERLARALRDHGYFVQTSGPRRRAPGVWPLEGTGAHLLRIAAWHAQEVQLDATGRATDARQSTVPTFRTNLGKEGTHGTSDGRYRKGPRLALGVIREPGLRIELGNAMTTHAKHQHPPPPPEHTPAPAERTPDVAPDASTSTGRQGRVDLSDAPADRARRSGGLPDLRHGARAADHSAGATGEPRAPRHDAGGSGSAPR